MALRAADKIKNLVRPYLCYFSRALRDFLSSEKVKLIRRCVYHYGYSAEGPPRVYIYVVLQQQQPSRMSFILPPQSSRQSVREMRKREKSAEKERIPRTIPLRALKSAKRPHQNVTSAVSRKNNPHMRERRES